MRSLKVMAAQIPVVDDISANVRTLEAALDAARDENVDILLTPEGSVSGYTHLFDKAQTEAALDHITAIAKQRGIGLALGTCYEEADGLRRNELRFYDKSGRYLGCHTKTLLCVDLADLSQGELNHFHTDPLRTFDFHGVTVGGLICNDLWANPTCTSMPDSHLTQQLSAMGAKVIFHAVNGGRDGSDWSQVTAKRFHETNLQLRAMAGKVWIVTADNSFPVSWPPSCYAGVISPEGEWMAKITTQGTQYSAFEIPV